MIKGSAVIKPASYGRWVRVFKAWIASGHVSCVIHCDSYEQTRYVQKSAAGFKRRNNEVFWTHTDGNDLYLIRPDPIKQIAMEVEQRKDGVIYFYDSAKAI